MWIGQRAVFDMLLDRSSSDIEVESLLNQGLARSAAIGNHLLSVLPPRLRVRITGRPPCLFSHHYSVMGI